MAIVYRLGSATAADVHAAMPDAPTYTSVRGLLRVLEKKGLLTHREDGPRYVYEPAQPREATGVSYLNQVIRSFFGGSPSDAVAALVGDARRPLTAAELRRLQDIVDRARARTP
jgi:predicted transcriptional regulator